ncbi:MAG: ATP-binding cassette domain-containing protein [Candidatus Acidiferrales bacterium]|jgi:ABC-2 type transport system ATP-binding protein
MALVDKTGNLQEAVPDTGPTVVNAVDTRAITRRFGSLVAVDHLTVAVPHGSVFGLLGPNGAGKSTLIKMLTTLLAPSEGTAYVAGFDIVREPRRVRHKIGYVSQMLSADGDLTGYENLLISAKLYSIPRKERAARIARALEFMKLMHVSDKLVKHYSGGMIRRLEIAQSMLHHPSILFLDEPTVGLDPFAKRAVWEDIRDLQREFGTTILMTTHDMLEADELCETVAFMHQGKLAAIGPPAKLKAALGASATLNDAFIHYTGAAITEGGDIKDVARTRLTSQRLG